MSLYERLAEAEKSMKFAASSGTDAFQHSDRSKQGRRNHSPKNFFKGRNQRFPAWNQWASVAGSIRQACQGNNADPAVCKKVQAFAKKRFGICTTDDGQCEKRDHGPGGPPEHTTACQGKHCGLPSDHGGQHPWPFQHKGQKKWDKDWTALGGEKGSGASQKQKDWKASVAKLKGELKAMPQQPSKAPKPKKKKKQEEFLPRRELHTLDVQEELHPAVRQTAKLAGQTMTASFRAKRERSAKQLKDLMAKHHRLVQGQKK